MPIKMRRRYLALKIDSAEKFEEKELLDTLWSAILRLYGEYGASKIGLTLIDCDVEKRFAVIRTAHTEVEKLRAAIASITEMMGKPAAVHVLMVSGTLKALSRKIFAKH
ncbi:MAG: Rpp14/Pop5 family protein [Candidatus Bathyarchaeia archaeon]